MGWSLAVLVGLASMVSAAAQTPTITPTDAIGIDYLDADLTTYAVTSFDVRYDGGTASSVGMPQSLKIAGTITGGSTYEFIPPFTSGNHTIEVRAVNSVGPGGWMSPFAFAVVGSAPTAVPVNARVVPR